VPDGVARSAGDTLTFGGVPEITALADGRVRLYVCANGIESYASADGGRPCDARSRVGRRDPRRPLCVRRPSGAP
jgi:hypothetical protein